MNQRRTLVVFLLTAMVAVVPVAGAATPVASVGSAQGPGGAAEAVDGAQECTFPVEVTDATGETVRIEEDPDRVVTLAPSAAQTMWELDAQDEVVGVSQFALYLEGAEDKTNVSAPGFGNYDVETIVALEPDVVLAPNVVGNETVEQLRDAGLTVVKFFAAEDVEDVERKTTLIGRFTGNCEAAEETNRWMNANVDAARDATADAERTKVLYVTGPPSSAFTTGDDTFINDMIYASGGRNVVAEAGVTGFKPVNEEIVADRDPEWIVTTNPESNVLDVEPYNSTTAGREGNLLAVNVNYLNQPAPRSVVMAVRTMTEAFHPDLYGPDDHVARSDVEVTTTTTTTAETTTTETTETTTTETTETTTTETTETTEETEEPTPGFEIAVTVLALLAALALYRRR